MQKTIDGIYENGTIRFPSVVRLGRKLPLRNRAHLRFTLILPDARGAARESFGLLRASKRLVRLVAEAPELSAFNS